MRLLRVPKDHIAFPWRALRKTPLTPSTNTRTGNGILNKPMPKQCLCTHKCVNTLEKRYLPTMAFRATMPMCIQMRRCHLLGGVLAYSFARDAPARSKQKLLSERIPSKSVHVRIVTIIVIGSNSLLLTQEIRPTHARLSRLGIQLVS